MLVHPLASHPPRHHPWAHARASARRRVSPTAALFALLLVAAVISPPRPARGQEPPLTPPVPGAPGQPSPVGDTGTFAATVDVELAIDLPLTLSAGLLAGSFALLKDDFVRDRCWPRCDASTLNGLDRPFAGRYDDAAAMSGDVVVGLTVALPELFGLLDLAMGEQPEGAVGFGEDTLILAETLALSALTHQVVAFAAQRPRPFAHGDRAGQERLTGANAYLSFYSGHTSNSFAMATAYATLYGIRHPHSQWRGALWALLPGLAAMEGGLRVLSGYHYPTDVLVGGAVGSAIGLVVPWLHATAPSAEPSVVVLPLAGPGLAGVSVAVR